MPPLSDRDPSPPRLVSPPTHCGEELIVVSSSAEARPLSWSWSPRFYEAALGAALLSTGVGALLAADPHAADLYEPLRSVAATDYLPTLRVLFGGAGLVAALSGIVVLRLASLLAQASVVSILAAGFWSSVVRGGYHTPVPALLYTALLLATVVAVVVLARDASSDSVRRVAAR